VAPCTHVPLQPVKKLDAKFAYDSYASQWIQLAHVMAANSNDVRYFINGEYIGMEVAPSSNNGIFSEICLRLFHHTYPIAIGTGAAGVH
jgi:hypothetical protein